MFAKEKTCRDTSGNSAVRSHDSGVQQESYAEHGIFDSGQPLVFRLFIKLSLE
jgi:hypothetical protein